jgi:hypothetical protein
MAKTYNFGEKKTEYNAKLGKEVEVWQSPKYLEAKKKAIEALESETYKGVLSEGDFWILMNGTKSGKMAYTGLIISHNGCLKINDALPADKRFKPSCMSLDKDGYNGSLIYSYSNDDQGVYEVGEVSSKNCTNAYPYAMALKRCMDRVILKNSSLAYAGIYSDSEAEEFKNEPKEESKAPANVSKTTTKTEAAPEVSGEEIQKNLIKLCKDNNLDLRQICKEYKINVNSTVEDLAAAYYALNNKILRGEL